MSHSCLADAFIDAEEVYRREVLRHAWGHLAPEQRRSYRGIIIFAYGAYGDIVVIDSGFPGLPDSPWFFEDQQEFIAGKATPEKAGKIFRFEGTYTKFKNEGFRFSGKTSEIVIT